MTRWLLGLSVMALLVGFAWRYQRSGSSDASALGGEREEVIFWHFWGGVERDAVDRVVARFNAAQAQYVVRPVAMPGNNFDVKLFLAITGGRPPDVVNQDDPILADWAVRGALRPLDEVLSAEEVAACREWLLPAALGLATVDDRLFALPNGLDVRALYFNASLLGAEGLSPPETIAELDALADRLTVLRVAANSPGKTKSGSVDGVRIDQVERIGFLPHPRNLWSWGIVFGGRFYDASSDLVTLDDSRLVAALEWMASYGRRFGSIAAAYRTRDQSLPGKLFPLLAGRYALIEDGQWRCRDVTRFQSEQRARGEAVTEFGVCPLPFPPGGRARAGWVNGNFFVLPRGGSNPCGAWAFMKFWSGLGGLEREGARTAIDGGWIPVSRHVIATRDYQDHLAEEPLFATFVELAASENLFPRPNIPGLPFIDREVQQVASAAIHRAGEREPRALLHEAQERIEDYRRRLAVP